MSDRPSHAKFAAWYVAARQQAIAHGVPIGELDWLLGEVGGVARLTLRLLDTGRSSMLRPGPQPAIAGSTDMDPAITPSTAASPSDRPFSHPSDNPSDHPLGSSSNNPSGSSSDNSLDRCSDADRPIVLTRSLADLDALWQRRLRDRTPVQYLAGSVLWRDLRLQVSPAVLIPRPETELILDAALAARAAEADPQGRGEIWADLGTGSGAIAIALALALPAARVVAVDCSAAALAIARHNAQTHLPDDLDFTASGSRFSLRQGSWFAPLEPERGQLAGLVSNPPYIPRAEVATLQPEVTDHEPHLALDGGHDGLDALRHLVAVAPDYLRSGGVWLVELMAGQAPTVVQLLRDRGAYQGIEILQDWAGIERFVLARRR